jgi:hypothetical protein
MAPPVFLDNTGESRGVSGLEEDLTRLISMPRLKVVLGSGRVRKSVMNTANAQ